MRSRIVVKSNLLFVCAFSLVAVHANSVCAKDLTFEADIRPILKTHCFQCHGESGEKKGGLDLRLRRLMLAGGESGPSVVADKPDKSYLLERVTSGEMPPGDDKHLSRTDIETIKRWISTGAKTARPEPTKIGDAPVFTEEERNWWSFQPIIRPVVPEVADAYQDMISAPIDAFVIAKLKELQSDIPLSDSDESDSDAVVDFKLSDRAWRATLIRRLTFNLLGLPPTLKEIAEFENDTSPDAWERLIARLLASPHYGERWGRHWLDVAGYADSEGYTDEDRVREHAYRYRDYVIQSFNSNKPFDQFIVEQLAGDELTTVAERQLLDANTVEKLTATGFLRMAPDGTASGGIDQNLARNQVMADTLQIVGTALLGLTVNCAQCHDHRYDPIPTADYYRMRAIFEPALDWKRWQTPAGRQVSLYTDADKQERTRIEAEAKVVDAERQKHIDRYITMTLEQELLLVADKQRDSIRKAYRAASKDRTEEQKKLLTDHPSIGRISGGALYLYERRRAARIKDLETKKAEKRAAYFADVSNFIVIDSTPELRELFLDARIEGKDKRSPEQKALLEKHPYVMVTGDSLKELKADVIAELQRYDAAVAEIRGNEIRKHLQELLDKATSIRATIPTEHFIRALIEKSQSIPQTFVFYRGDHDQPKLKVKPASLSVLSIDGNISESDSTRPTSGRRLQFAQHLTSDKHPLVARVLVNRIWMQHFGRGLVNSPGDFGVLGEKPTHPKLLDWLAVEFIESGWNVKHLHRLIVNSATYQQSSICSDEVLIDADPANVFYGRSDVRRLESEALRDAILSVSGQLNRKLYGPPVPVMEDGVGQIVIGKENLDGERKPTKAIPLNGEEFRRSVYVQVRRSRPLAVLDTFDSPLMTPNCASRSNSNVAPQALLMMNSNFALQYSEKFAERLLKSGLALEHQITAAWLMTFGAHITESELASAAAFVTHQTIALKKQNGKLASDEIHRRALSSLCQALLSANRFLYVD
jgi:hypothetical protein